MGSKSESALWQQNTPGSAVALGKLWVFGGDDDFFAADNRSTIPHLRHASPKGEPATPATTNSARVYDPLTNIWGTARDMNVARSLPAATAVGSKLFAAGGIDDNFFTTLSSAEIVEACVVDANPPPPPT